MQIPFISRAYAQQLEFKGEHSLALQVRRNDSSCIQAVDMPNVSLSNAACHMLATS